MESIRTERGPRQRDVLNMGVEFDLPKEEWKDFADYVEETITGQKHLIDYPEEIRKLAGEGYLKDSLIKPTVVVDAGIASEKNIQWLKDNCYPSDVRMIAVKKDDKTNTVLVQAGLAKNKETDEVELYCLRTSREDLDEQQIWNIYTMLTDIEDAFRCMKSELGLRPIYHQKEARCDGHIFITLFVVSKLASPRA